MILNESFYLTLMPFYWHPYSFVLQYQPDDPINLWVNKVGPYNNPQETYNYYSLPFCRRPGNPGHKWGGLGEVLGGNELIDSQFDIKYQSMWIHDSCRVVAYAVKWYMTCLLLQRMWIRLQFASLNLMKQRLSSLRRLLRITIGLNFSWVCLLIFSVFLALDIYSYFVMIRHALGCA